MSERAIVERLEKLEKSNRRLKAGLGLCAAVLVAAVVIGAEQAAGPITARESIRLVDEEGKPRIVLGCDKDGTFLFLNDEAGRIRTSIAAQSKQTYINFKDDQGNTRMVLLLDESGPSMKLRNAEGAPLAAVASDEEGGLVQIVDTAGKSRVIGTLSDVVSEPKAEK